jgi:hypothetical protein
MWVFCPARSNSFDPFRPSLPSQYLGTYLLSYVKSKEMEASKQEAEKRMAVLLEEANAANAAAEAEAAAAAAAQAEKDKEEEALANELATSTDTASLYGKVLDLIKVRRRWRMEDGYTSACCA